MNKVTTGVFGGIGLLLVVGVFLNDLVDGLTEPIAGVEPSILIMLVVGVLVAWLFYIGTQVSNRGGL